jgi:hypothetical protein
VAPVIPAMLATVAAAGVFFMIEGATEWREARHRAVWLYVIGVVLVLAAIGAALSYLEVRP